MGRRRNELRNAAGLILKLSIIVAVQDLKISFDKQILLPPRFWLVPFCFIYSGDGTALSALVKQSVLENDLNYSVFFYWQQCIFFFYVELN